MTALEFPHDELAAEALRFTVYGQAAPAGSKRHVGNGRIVDSSKRSAPWKNIVAEFAWRAMTMPERGGEDAPLLDGPLSVRMTFYVPRPKGHYSQKRHTGTTRSGDMARAADESRSVSWTLNPAPLLRPSAPAWPTTRPDVLKLARAVEDACTGIIWRDDAQIVSEWLEKKYGEPARVEVVVVQA